MNTSSNAAGVLCEPRVRKYLQARVAVRVGLAAALCGLSLSGLSSAAWAQAAGTRTVYFYSGAGQAEAKPGSWGNGAADKAQDADYENADALKVTTRNLNEGIRFDLAQPIDITPYLAPGANGLVRLRVRFASAFGGGGYPGGGPGYPGQGPGYPGGPQEFPGQGGPPDGPGGDEQGGPFPGGGPDEGGGDAGGLDGGGVDGGGMEGGAPLVSPALAKPAALSPASAQGPALEAARRASLPRVLGAPQTRALAQYGQREGQRGGGFAQGGGFPQGGAPGGTPGGAGGGVPPGGFPPGGEGGPGMMAGPPPQRTPIGRFQVTMVLDRGIMTGGLDFSLRGVPADDAGWRLLTVPLADMKATPGASGPVRRVIITTDKEDTWYLGQAALSVDAKEIAVSLRQPKDAPGAQIAEITVAPGPISLVADVEAGSSDVAVDWNFDADNAGAPPVAPAAGPGAGGPAMGGPEGGPTMGGPNRGGPMMGGGGPMEGGAAFGGPRVDARGLIGKFDYPNEEQNYRVEVTVRDRAHKKKPVKAQILVKVRG